MAQPSHTLIAGPNGAGKSCLVQALRERGVEFANHYNADDIALGLTGGAESVNQMAQQLVTSARVTAVEDRQPFAYETDLSHPSHVTAMERARARGYFVRLFFIGTETPQINLDRVADRVAKGGHDVPPDRITARWQRVMEDQLIPAIRAADESFVFDNSAKGDGIGPLRVARIMQKFAFRHETPGLTWPERYLWSKLAATGDYVISPR